MKLFSQLLLLFLANSVYADTVNLRCELLYIDLDTKSNSVIFSYAGNMKKTQLLKNEHFYSFTLNSAINEEEMQEYNLDRKTLILRTWSAYTIPRNIDRQCQIIQPQNII
jgi:hypothetical protein